MPARAEVSEDDRAAIAAQIEEARARLERQRTALTVELDGIIAAAELEPPDDEHDPEGTTAYERAQVTSLLGEVEARLVQLEAAQRRVDAGDVGRCDRCHGPIGAERMLAIPETTSCVTCAAALSPAVRPAR